MRRVLQIVGALALSVALLAPGVASAGGVVTDGHGGAALVGPGFELRYLGAAPILVDQRPERLALAELSAKEPAPEGTLQPLDATELEQIHAGLITEEEASAGCGGATAARSDAGLLPLLVAGLALVLARRRR